MVNPVCAKIISKGSLASRKPLAIDLFLFQSFGVSFPAIVRGGRPARPRKRTAEVHQADAPHHRRMAAVQAQGGRGKVVAGGNPQETQEVIDHILLPVRGKGLVQPDMRRRKHPCGRHHGPDIVRLVQDKHRVHRQVG